MRPEERALSNRIGAIAAVMFAIGFGIAGWYKADTYTRWPFFIVGGSFFGVALGVASRLLIVPQRQAREGDPTTNDWLTVVWTFIWVILAAACLGLA